MGIGFGIAAIASLFYVAAWELYLYFTNYTFMEEYTRLTIQQAQKAVKSAAEIIALADEMDGFNDLYANPLTRMGLTLSVILPVAPLMPNFSATLLRNSRFMPARR